MLGGGGLGVETGEVISYSRDLPWNVIAILWSYQQPWLEKKGSI